MWEMADTFISVMMATKSFFIYRKKVFPWIKRISSFIRCTELNWKVTDVNGLGASIFLKYMGWYLGVPGKLHDDECMIYIFTGNVINGNPSIFNK